VSLVRSAPAIAVLAFVIYAATLTRNYTGDSIRFAMVVESPELREILAPQRMLVHPLGLGFYRLWQLLGWSGGALLPLQVLAALAGAASVGLLCLIGRSVTGSPRLAALVALGFAVSAGTWLFSTEAELITVPLAANLAVLWALLASPPERAARPLQAIALGLGTGLATLTWLTGVFLVPVVLVGMALSPGDGPSPRPLRQAVLFLAAAALVVLPAYLLMMVLAFGVRDWQGLLAWRLYGGSSGTADLLYGQLGLSSLPHGAYAFLRTLAWYPDLDVGASTTYYLAHAGWSQRAAFAAFHGAVLVLAAAPLLVALVRRRLPADRRTLAVLATWTALFAAFAIYWVPGDTQFWLPVLAAWWLLAGIALGARVERRESRAERRETRVGPYSTLHSRLSALAAAAAVTALLVVNAFSLALPNRAIERNRPYQIAMSVRERTGPDDLILTGGGEALFLYIPYFAQRRTVSLFHELLGARDKRDETLAALDREIAAVRGRGGRVFLVGAEPGRDMWSHVADTVRQTTDYLHRLKTRPAWRVQGEEVLEVVT
jgi:hypothetical protein